MNRFIYSLKNFIAGLVLILAFFSIGMISYIFIPNLTTILFPVLAVAYPLVTYHKLKLRWNGFSIFIFILINALLVIFVSPKLFHYYQYRKNPVIYIDYPSDIDSYSDTNKIWAIRFEKNIFVNTDKIYCEASTYRSGTSGRKVSHDCIAPLQSKSHYDDKIRFIVVDSNLNIRDERLETKDYTKSKRKKIWDNLKFTGGLVIGKDKSLDHFQGIVKKTNWNIHDRFFTIEVSENIYADIVKRKRVLYYFMIGVVLIWLLCAILEGIFIDLQKLNRDK